MYPKMKMGEREAADVSPSDASQNWENIKSGPENGPGKDRKGI